MSMAMLHLTALRLRAAPTPMMAVVLVWVVETGRPPKVATARLTQVDRLAAKPWNASIFTMSTPTLLMMRSPPAAVPKPMDRAQNTMSHTGSTMLAPVMPMPTAMVIAKRKMDMNFWPSWAPCIKATPAPAKICAQRKKRLALGRLRLRQKKPNTLKLSQPKPKPMSVESRMP